MADKLAAPPPTNTISPADFVSGVIEAERLKQRIDEANDRYRAHLKKLEEKGVDMKALAEVRRLRKLDDDEQAIRLKTTVRYARWLNMPVGSQPGLFDDDPAPQKVLAEATEWTAEKEGYEAGEAGRNGDDSPFPAGSPLHQKWYEGWCRGQALLAEGLGPKKRGKATPDTEDAVAKPGRRRRGSISHPAGTA